MSGSSAVPPWPGSTSGSDLGPKSVPVLVNRSVLTHPQLSLAARDLYALMSALEDEGARAALEATPQEMLAPLLSELSAAGYAWRDRDDEWVVGDPTLPGLRCAPEFAPARPPGNDAGWAYAIADRDRHLVKIGTSRDVPRRLRALQTSSPHALEVLWQGRGGPALEAHLHERFATRRVRGEWFDFTGVDAEVLIAAAALSYGSAG